MLGHLPHCATLIYCFAKIHSGEKSTSATNMSIDILRMMLPNARTSASLYSAHTHTVLESSKIKSCKNAIQCSHYIAALLMLHCTGWYSMPCSACIVLLSVFLRTVQSSQQSLNFESCAKMDKCSVLCPHIIASLFHCSELHLCELHLIKC